MRPIHGESVNTNAFPSLNPPAKRSIDEVQEPEPGPSNKRLPPFGAASAPTLTQFQHRHPGGDVSLHFFRFAALPESLKRYASENLGRIQALAETMATVSADVQNKAIREAPVEDLELLVHLRTASITAREMGAVEIQEREENGPSSTAFPIEPTRDMSNLINMDPPIESIPFQSSVDRAKVREAQALAEYLGAPPSFFEYCRALWSARTTILRLLAQLETVSPEIQNLVLNELREREAPDPYLHRYIKDFEALPEYLKTHAIENLRRVQALAENLEAAPDVQNEAIREALVKDLELLVHLRTASMTAREMGTIEIEAREKGLLTAFPKR